MPRTKQPTMPLWLSRLLLGGLAAILVLMPVHAFLSTWGGTSIGPLWIWKSWKELLLCLLTAPALAWLSITPLAIKQLSKKPLVIVLTAYLLLTVCMAVLFWQQNGQAAVEAGLAMNLRYLGVGALAYLVFLYGSDKSDWLNAGKWFVVCAGISVAVLGILQVLVMQNDALTSFGYDKDKTIAPVVLIDENPNLPRAFATLRGPNDFGAYLILPFLLILTFARRMPLWVVVTALGLLGTALLLSSSRSAWLGLAGALVVYGAYTVVPRLSRLAVIGIIGGALLAVTIMFYMATSVPLLRQAVFHSSPQDPTLTEGSTDQHFSATAAGIARVISHPLGCGVGCAGPASYYGSEARISENYFVQIAEEVGVLGLILFLMLLGIVLYKLHTVTRLSTFSHVLLAAAVGYIVIGQMLHVWSDDPLSITWWLLAGGVIGYNESTTWRKSKGSSR